MALGPLSNRMAKRNVALANPDEYIELLTLASWNTRSRPEVPSDLSIVLGYHGRWTDRTQRASRAIVESRSNDGILTKSSGTRYPLQIIPPLQPER
jgi:hypothetical protein